MRKAMKIGAVAFAALVASAGAAGASCPDAHDYDHDYDHWHGYYKSVSFDYDVEYEVEYGVSYDYEVAVAHY